MNTRFRAWDARRQAPGGLDPEAWGLATFAARRYQARPNRGRTPTGLWDDRDRFAGPLGV